MAIAHDLPLVTTIALGFSSAFVCGLIAAKLRLPPIVGYLIGGILIGPYTPGVMADPMIAEQLSEIGIILLMFGVGLHFSLRDLWEVRKIAIPGAIVQIAAATGLGVLASHFWGWSLPAGLLFGLALSVASTVVLLRALEEHNLLQSNNGHIAIGWLIVEDIVMVMALVLIPAIAGGDIDPSDTKAWVSSLGMALGKLSLFVLLMVVAGRRILPWLLTTVARTRSRELFTLSVFAVAVGVAFGASKLFGVSFALGAFFAGMMIRESDLSHEAADKALPLQDAFAVLFFVSVGMLFNPHVILEQPLHVLITTGIIIVGKSIAAFLIILLFRYPLKTAMIVSAGLAQIGEFSFILAALGISYGILSEEARDLVLAGAIASIALNPVFFVVSRWIYEWMARHPEISRRFNMGDDELSHLSEEEKQTLRDLVILVGYGRVGKHICTNIESSYIDLVVVDANRERVELLREKGSHAIAGDATHEATLREAAIDNAVAIIVAIPNPFEARRIVETARKLNPNIRVLARAHNDEEMEYFAEQGVDLAVMGPREVGRRMVEYLSTVRSNVRKERAR